ncbi:MAG: transcription antitermination factor NusB [Clostridia bacterium]|nr:transcription antitermination factor NusB [Clostridia bacterium]
MKRTDERELAFKSIYSKFFNPTMEIDDENIDVNKAEFANKILDEYTKHQDEVHTLISNNLKGYTIDRLYKIDLAILILTIVEVNYIGTPKEIVINEAVELAKKFSTEKSPRFINGFLAQIIK